MTPDGKPIARELDGGSALDRVFRDCSTARLYAAAVHTVSELGCAITSRDDAAMKAEKKRLLGPMPDIEH